MTRNNVYAFLIGYFFIFDLFVGFMLLVLQFSLNQNMAQYVDGTYPIYDAERAIILVPGLLGILSGLIVMAMEHDKGL